MKGYNTQQHTISQWRTHLQLCVHVLWCLCLLSVVTGCTLPEPAPHNLPTSPAILDITPAPTLDINATATMLANKLRPTPTPAGLYIVQTGDTLSTIAVEFDTTVEEIMVANGLTDANNIQDGQALTIPSLLPDTITSDTIYNTDGMTMQHTLPITTSVTTSVTVTNHE